MSQNYKICSIFFHESGSANKHHTYQSINNPNARKSWYTSNKYCRYGRYYVRAVYVLPPDMRGGVRFDNIMSSCIHIFSPCSRSEGWYGGRYQTFHLWTSRPSIHTIPFRPVKTSTATVPAIWFTVMSCVIINGRSNNRYGDSPPLRDLTLILHYTGNQEYNI